MAVKVDQDTCIGCGACVGTCPAVALDFNEDGKAECNTDVCIGCLACTGVCPVNAIYEE